MTIRIDRVTTRGGDNGQTSLADGSRVGKDAPRIGAMGDVDEANAQLGRLRALRGAVLEHDAFLIRVQNDLFDLGAGLCRPGAVSRLPPEAVTRLEDWAAEAGSALPALTSFVLPGGSAAAAEAHLARTIVRRAERGVVALGIGDGVDPLACRYLNRLSDSLFVLARLLNDRGAGDVLWTPARSG